VQLNRHLTAHIQQGLRRGLAIARDLAWRMGGDLTVASSGEASRCTLSLRHAAGGGGEVRAGGELAA
jgi:hypothetical protein